MTAGREKTPHQTPLIPIASLRESVDPFSMVTGTSAITRRRIPARYPVAIPLEDMRDVAIVSALEYSTLAFKSAGGDPETKRPASSESSVSSKRPVGCGASARAAAALVTSSEFRARDGK